MTDHKWIALGNFRYVCEVCGDRDVSQTCGNLPKDGCFHPDSFLGRRGGMVPTVQLGPNASQGVTPERKALKDIVELIDNQYDDLYVLRMVDQIAKKALE